MKDILVYFLLGLAALGLGLGTASNLDCATLCFDKEDAESVSYLFVQEAESGTLVEEEGGDYTLTLQGVSVSTVVFSDRPVRDAFMMTTADFVESFGVDFAGDPPNASLSFELTTGGAPSVAVFTIDHPILNEDAGTLSYRVKDIGLSREDSANLPASFGPASLFIDAFSPTPIQMWTLDIIVVDGKDIGTGSATDTSAYRPPPVSGVVITAGGSSGTSDSEGAIQLSGELGTLPTSLTATLNGVDVLMGTDADPDGWEWAFQQCSLEVYVNADGTAPAD